MPVRAVPSRPRPLGRLVACGALAFALLVAASGCGGDDPQGNVVADVLKDDELPTQPAVATTEAEAPKECESAKTEVTIGDAPEVTVPEGEPPTEIQITDVTVGEGHAVEAGDDAKVLYTGVKFSDGEEFDSSWKDPLTPFDVAGVGQASVIAGWNQGLIGMRPGGRRQIVIPPDLAYGPADDSEGAHELAGETLVFVIDLREVCFPEPETTTTTAPAEGTTTAPAGDDTTTTAPEGASSTTTGADDPTSSGDDTTTTAPE